MNATLMDRIQDLEQLALRQGERIEFLEERLELLFSHAEFKRRVAVHMTPDRHAA
jgi:hypothetical protein